MDKQAPHNPKRNQQDNSNKWLQYSGMATEMIFIIGIFAVLGYYADNKLNTKPFLLILLLLLGASISLYRIYKQLT